MSPLAKVGTNVDCLIIIVKYRIYCDVFPLAKEFMFLNLKNLGASLLFLIWDEQELVHAILGVDPSNANTNMNTNTNTNTI